MPQVPLPRVGLSTAATPAFGAPPGISTPGDVAGQQIQQTGAALTKAGSAISMISSLLQEETDVASAQEGVNQFSEFITETLLKPPDEKGEGGGYLGLQGRAAVLGRDAKGKERAGVVSRGVLDAIKERGEAIAEGRASSVANGMFREKMRLMMQSATQKVYGHETNQRAVWNRGVKAANLIQVTSDETANVVDLLTNQNPIPPLVVQAAQAAGGSPTQGQPTQPTPAIQKMHFDPKDLQQDPGDPPWKKSLDAVVFAAEEKAKANNWGKEEKDLAVLDAKSKFYAGVVDSLIAEGKTKIAKDFMKQIRNNPADSVTMKRLGKLVKIAALDDDVTGHVLKETNTWNDDPSKTDLNKSIKEFQERFQRSQAGTLKDGEEALSAEGLELSTRLLVAEWGRQAAEVRDIEERTQDELEAAQKVRDLNAGVFIMGRNKEWTEQYTEELEELRSRRLEASKAITSPQFDADKEAAVKAGKLTQKEADDLTIKAAQALAGTQTIEEEIRQGEMIGFPPAMWWTSGAVTRTLQEAEKLVNLPVGDPKKKSTEWFDKVKALAKARFAEYKALRADARGEALLRGEQFLELSPHIRDIKDARIPAYLQREWVDFGIRDDMDTLLKKLHEGTWDPKVLAFAEQVAGLPYNAKGNLKDWKLGELTNRFKIGLSPGQWSWLLSEWKKAHDEDEYVATPDRTYTDLLYELMGEDKLITGHTGANTPTAAWDSRVGGGRTPKMIATYPGVPEHRAQTIAEKEASRRIEDFEKGKQGDATPDEKKEIVSAMFDKRTMKNLVDYDTGFIGIGTGNEIIPIYPWLLRGIKAEERLKFADPDPVSGEFKLPILMTPEFGEVTVDETYTQAMGVPRADRLRLLDIERFRVFKIKISAAEADKRITSKAAQDYLLKAKRLMEARPVATEARTELDSFWREGGVLGVTLKPGEQAKRYVDGGGKLHSPLKVMRVREAFEKKAEKELEQQEEQERKKKEKEAREAAAEVEEAAGK